MSLPEGAPAATLTRSRQLLGGLVAAVIGAALASMALASAGSLGFMLQPISLIGLISPVLGYRLYQLGIERLQKREGVDAKCAGFLRAHLTAAGTTTGVALLGVVAHGLTAEPLPLAGVLGHLLLVGAIWPGPERLERALEDRP